MQRLRSSFSLLLLALPLACAATAPALVAPPAPPPGAPRPDATSTAPARPPEPPPPAPAPPPAGPLAELAEAVPFTLEQVGFGGRWLAYCAARADTDRSGALEVKVGTGGALGGDALVPELAVGGRATESIDDLLGHDPTGRYVVVRKGKSVLLLDVTSEARVDLSALGFDDRDDVLPYRQHRALAFDPRGELLAYVRTNPRALVLRTLASGSERALGDLPGEPFRFAWDGSGESLVLTAVVEDTGNNGRLDWPARAAKRRRLACQGPVPRFSVAAESGDRPATFVLPRDGERFAPAPDFASSFGRDWVARASDGVLSLVAQGKRRAFATADCGARILHASLEYQLFVVACVNAKSPGKALVELVAPGYRLDLGVFVQPSLVDRSPEAPARLVPLYPGSEVMLLDLAKRLALPLAPGDRVLATSGARALVRRRKALVVVDADSGTEQTLPGEVARLPAVVTAGSFAVVGDALVDVAAGRRAGTVNGRALAVTPAGDVLVAASEASADQLARGPARFQPRPASPP